MRVFITGASGGLGAALAKLYAGPGASLGLLARRRDALEAIAAGLLGTVSIYPADVRDADAVCAAGEDFLRRAGVPDIVIACAGVSVGTDTAEREDLAVFRAVMDINVLGMAHTFHPFTAAMRNAGRGTLAGISSVAGIRGLPGAGAYSASKAAAGAYLESLRVELRASGVRVVDIAPGYIATAMTAVNPYRMPFLLGADEAARRVARVIARGRSRAVIPWQMAVLSAILRALPNPVYDRVFQNAPRKPRKLPI